VNCCVLSPAVTVEKFFVIYLFYEFHSMCHSNDPKHKRSKVVHRKKQQQARHCLQASSRQAVQESATTTAMTRPLNFPTMATTSKVSSEHSHNQGGPQELR